VIFHECAVRGAFVIEPERLEDDRGFFARTWSAEEFAARGLDPCLAQCSVSFNRAPHTLRGMHYQAAPHEETKVVRCTRGAMYDVVLDLRADSPSYRRWFGVELRPETLRMLYVPKGCAHGFLTLEADTEVFYQISTPFHGPSGRGVRWDDPAFAIEWPAEPRVMAERDRRFADHT
jgi:dTDP-4-dehydrorhamnose 3,5-epimerase